MPRGIRAGVTPKAKDEKIYAWPVVSQKTRVAGMAAKYTVLLWSHGGLTCDCPGWIFYHRKNGGCKHTESVKAEAGELFESWKRGETLPGQEQDSDPGTQVTANKNPSARKTAAGDENSKLKYGRFIDID